MRILLPVILMVGALTVTATASPISISFDQLQSGEAVLNYYNGGFGSLGTGPGPSMGVIFSSDWIVSPPDVYGAPGGKSAALSSTAILNVPAGLSGPLSFYYSGAPLVVNFYDQLGGAGNLVQTLSLTAQGSFQPAGTAVPLFLSAVFQSSGNRIDALTGGAFVVPEPGAWQLALLGIGVLSALSRRRMPR